MPDEEMIDSAPEAPSLPQLSLNILQVIKPAQQQNGLKHGDYGRYRQYCKSRLHNLRKTLKLTHGKGKYSKRKLEAHHMLDSRYLHIPLVNAERAWAYAMEIKKQVEDQVHKRKRRHLVSRLAKAARWAGVLSDFASQRCDTRSALEAEAYACWMQGTVLFEKESDWEKALSQFIRARTLFLELSKVADLEHQTYCTQMVEEIDSAIRYCNYSIQRQHGSAPEQAAQLLKLAESQAAKSDLLQSKLSALQQEASREQLSTGSSSSLEWRGQKVAVRNEKIRMGLHAAGELAQQLAASTAGKADVAEEDLEERLALYDKMVNAYNEAKSHIRAGLRAATEGDGQYQELQQLETLLSGTVLEHNIQRSSLLLQNARKRFTQQLQSVGNKTKSKDKERPVKAEELVRLHDALVRNIEELAELGSKIGGRQGEALVDKCSTQVCVQQASRCFYVGHIYMSGEKKYAEAYALFNRTMERCSQAIELVESGMEVDESSIHELQALSREARAFRLAAYALYRADQEKVKQAAQQGVEALGLEEQQQQQQQTADSGWLLDQLDEWKSFAGSGNKNVRIYQAPYTLQTVPVSPIMLDTAFGLIEYPSLEHRLPKRAEQKSTFARLFSWR